MEDNIRTFFLVKVEFETETDAGKMKKIKSQYLVDAMTCTEAEAHMVTYLKGTVLDYEITSATKSPIEDVVNVTLPITA